MTKCGENFLYLSQNYCFCHRLSVSVTGFQFLSLTFCKYYRLSVSGTGFLFPSQTFCFCHIFSVSLTHFLFLSQTFCVFRWLTVDIVPKKRKIIFCKSKTASKFEQHETTLSKCNSAQNFILVFEETFTFVGNFRTD